jgi:hypothetical protein
VVLNQRVGRNLQKIALDKVRDGDNLVADLMLDKQALQAVLSKKW